MRPRSEEGDVIKGVSREWHEVKGTLGFIIRLVSVWWKISASQSGARSSAGPANANRAPETSARVPLEQLPGLRRVGENEFLLEQ
jgi:hypothetical protein